MNCKIKIFMLVCVLMCALGVSAASEMYVGHCDGAIATATSGKILGRIGKGNISAITKLSSSLWSEYVGKQILGVRVGLPESNNYPDSITLWVRATVDGTNLAQSTIATNATAGWKAAHFETPIIIEAAQSYYVGFTFDQSSKMEIISCVGAPYEECIYVAKDGNISDYSNQGYGGLSAEAIVEADNVPQNNIAILDAQLGVRSVVKGDSVPLIMTVKNQALASQNGFIVECTLGDATKRIKIDDVLNYRDTKTYQLSMATEGVSLGVNEHLGVKLLLADGSEDEDMSDNTASLSFVALTTGYERNVVLEQFSTERCGFCPQGTAVLKQAYQNLGADNARVFWATHHSGFYQDWLTIDASKAYEWFYGPGGTFAPAYMLNRALIPQMNSKGYPVASVGGNADGVAQIISSELRELAPVSVSLEVKAVDGGQYELTIGGERTSEFLEICPQARVTVMITEDGIKAVHQTSATDYIHDHAVRAVCTATWGDVIEWDGDNFTTKYLLTPGEDWVLDNVKVIAMVHAYNDADCNASVVYNAAGAALGDNAAVTGIDSDRACVVATRWCDLNGVEHLRPATKGMWLKQEVMSDGNVSTTKVVVR